MQTNILLIVLYLGLFQGIFLAFALFLLKNKSRVSVYSLITLVLCFSSLILIQILRYHLPESSISKALVLGSGIPFLIGPLLYFYLASTVEQAFAMTWKKTLHLVPFLLVTLLSTWLSDKTMLGSTLFLLLKSAQTLIYYLWCLKLLSRKSIEKKVWYNRKLLYRLFFIQLMAFVIIHLIVVLEMEFPSWHLESDLISSMIFVFFFFAFVLTIIVFPNGTLPDQHRSRYQLSLLPEKQKQVIKDQLTRLLATEKMYLDPDLTLSLVASKMNVSSNHLSQVINETLKKNFNQLINEYRVNEVKRLISDEQKTLLNIAYESGFNSKSAFNRIFKGIEGQTPSTYRKMTKK